MLGVASGSNHPKLDGGTMARLLCRSFVTLVFVVVLCPPLVAQPVTGTIQGTVTDRSGGAMPGVTVTIRNVETGLERVAVSASNGFYSAPYLPIGIYNVQAELAGFGTMRHNNARVDLNQTAVHDFVLNPAAMSATGNLAADA